MQKITRTLTQYKIRAYEVNGGTEPQLNVVMECQALGTSMTKAVARAALAQVGEPPRKGLTITWEPVSQITYAMPLDQFIAQAEIVDTTDL